MTTSAVRPSASKATVWPAITSSGSRRAAWDQTLADDEPAGEQEQSDHAEDYRRGLVQTAVDREWPRLTLRESSELRGDEEQQAGVTPEEEAAAQAARCGTEPDPPTPAPCEEIDRPDRERQQCGQEHELERPAADEARAEVHVARRSLRELEPGIERAHETLGRAAELTERARR